ncbi:hypothetical protein ACWD4N_46605 [Streptomyces sp. NPDC002586]
MVADIERARTEVDALRVFASHPAVQACKHAAQAAADHAEANPQDADAQDAAYAADERIGRCAVALAAGDTWAVQQFSREAREEHAVPSVAVEDLAHQPIDGRALRAAGDSPAEDPRALEGDLGAAARPRVHSSPLVSVAEVIARHEADAERLGLVARERQAWASDMAELFREVVGVRGTPGCDVLGVDVADVREWFRHARDVASRAAVEADRPRFEAERLRREVERNREALDAVRERAVRMFSGEVREGWLRWASHDGRTVIVAPAPNPDGAPDAYAAETAYAGFLAGAVAAKDEERWLTSKDVPSKKSTGRGPGSDFKSSVARSRRPLIQPWKAPRIPAKGRALDGGALVAFDADGVCAETEAAPGV